MDLYIPMELFVLDCTKIKEVICCSIHVVGCYPNTHEAQESACNFNVATRLYLGDLGHKLREQ